VIRARDLAFLTGGLLAGVFFAARVSAAPPIVVQAPPGTAGAAAPLDRGGYGPTTATLPGLPAPCASVPVVTRVNDDTVISVKDEGDSQLVFVYSFDDHGTMKAVPQKARFFYKF
jgi:hypothetical protein